MAKIRTLGGLPRCLANSAHRSASTAAKATTSSSEFSVANSAGEASKDAIAQKLPMHQSCLGLKGKSRTDGLGRLTCCGFALREPLGHRPKQPKHRPHAQPHTQQIASKPHRTHWGLKPVEDKVAGVQRVSSVPIKNHQTPEQFSHTTSPSCTLAA